MIDEQILICQQCGKEYKVKLSLIKTSKFCSQLCRNKWDSINKCGKNNPNYNGGLITLTCHQCDEEFKVILSRKNTAKFCSRKCKGIYTTINRSGKNSLLYNKITLTCKQCGNDFEVIPILKNKRSCCSSKCYGEWQSINRIGIKNSQWRGGISGNPYPIEFNNQLKTKIRNKYNNCDYISGIHKNICNNGVNLSIHHVNYDKQNCNIGNLIPLSRVNHTRTNVNRDFWNRLFTYSLEYEKEYYGDE